MNPENRPDNHRGSVLDFQEPRPTVLRKNRLGQPLRGAGRGATGG